MNEKIIPLDCDDVILLGKDTFKVSRLKELIEKQIRHRLQRRVYESNSLEPGVSMLELFNLISLGEHHIKLSEIQFNYVINCQVLRISSEGWRKGKLNIEVCILSLNPNLNQIYLEFHPEEFIEYDSLLDDICKIIAEN
ncbi:KGK family protein [Mastigocladus laminosus UU774]|nr:MAG: KGK family protein [Hapalosiphonaceae cyanobacterium JJU2]TBR57910.1 KGK family protein [Westiellopsis prolifica IICB1]TFI53911.1 KGK family protein [Mastigocladus laminosus UU774]